MAELRAQVERVAPARFLGLHCTPAWSGPSHLEVGTQRYRIACARSVLEFRQHLADCEQADECLVCLTDLEARDLGLDLLARLAKRRLLSPEPWAAVRARFRVRHIDPDLTRQGRTLAMHLLMAPEPAEGLPVPGGDELSADWAWTFLFRQALGVATADVPDPVAVMAWSWQADSGLLAPSDLVEAARAWFARRWGPAAEVLFAALGAGSGRDLLPLGLVCLALFDPRAEDPKAAVRLERFVANQPIEAEVGRRWGAWALAALEQAGPPAPILHRCDQLLEELHVKPLARLCPVSPLGFHQLLGEFGEELAHEAPAERLQAILEELRGHREARLGSARLEPLQMAVRLTRWLTRSQAAPDSFALLASRYLSEGSFVDRARYKLLRGTGPESLRAALASLFERIRQRREEENRRFGLALSGWYAAHSPSHPEVLPVEEVLAAVVAPLARQQPVFLVVLDGATWAVVHELLEDLNRRGWSLRAVHAVLATLPSVTEFSRTSLLCGRLAAGQAAAEAREFPKHPALAAACSAGAPPCLYHRLEVDEAYQAAQATLLKRLEDRKPKVVAAVVNAVDDHLARDGQFDVPWTLDSLRALAPLLEAAQRARRVLVLASDHGHILEYGTRLISSKDGGDRWRPAGSPSEQEVRIEGGRLAALGLEAVLAPWSETVRYGVKKNGYHGGAALQEMVAPLAVLAPAGVLLEGHPEISLPQPDWWTSAPAAGPVRLYTPPPTSGPGQGELFPDTSPSPLFEALRQAPGFAERCQQKGVDFGALQRLLEVLERAEGRLPVAELASRLQLTEPALRERLSPCAAVLNLDGRALLTLSVDAEQVLLDLEGLARAYGLTAGPQAAEILLVTTVQGRELHLDLPIPLTELDRQVIRLLARHGTLSERALAQAARTRRAAGAVEGLVERLAQAGRPWLEPAGQGEEGRLYRFREDRLG